MMYFKIKTESDENWEKIENNLTGSFLSFAQGFKEGSDLDDEQ